MSPTRRVTVKIRGVQRERRFPADTPAKTIRAWRDECRVALRARPRSSQGAATLRVEIDRYLPQVRAMPTYAQREQHLDLWLAALGDATPRASVTPEAIRTILQRWRQTLTAATCNKRRTALMHVWSVLDGKGARNPVRDVPKFRVPDPLPRGHDPHVLDASLLRAPRCRSRAACRVLLWTGMRPCELQRAERGDVDLAGRAVLVRTAKGGRVRVVSLTAQAVSAWEEFAAAAAWGDVPQAAPLNRWLQRATGLPLRVYDLRHSYGTALARRETRLDVIASLMGHSSLELTRRYVLAAVTPDSLRATVALGHTAGEFQPSASQTSRNAAESGGIRRTQEGKV